jgi:hypothetical protein
MLQKYLPARHAAVQCFLLSQFCPFASPIFLGISLFPCRSGIRLAPATRHAEPELSPISCGYQHTKHVRLAALLYSPNLIQQFTHSFTPIAHAQLMSCLLRYPSTLFSSRSPIPPTIVRIMPFCSLSVKIAPDEPDSKASCYSSR